MSSWKRHQYKARARPLWEDPLMMHHGPFSLAVQEVGILLGAHLLHLSHGFPMHHLLAAGILLLEHSCKKQEITLMYVASLVLQLVRRTPLPATLALFKIWH